MHVRQCVMASLPVPGIEALPTAAAAKQQTQSIKLKINGSSQ